MRRFQGNILKVERNSVFNIQFAQREKKFSQDERMPNILSVYFHISFFIVVCSEINLSSFLYHFCPYNIVGGGGRGADKPKESNIYPKNLGLDVSMFICSHELIHSNRYLSPVCERIAKIKEYLFHFVAFYYSIKPRFHPLV